MSECTYKNDMTHLNFENTVYLHFLKGVHCLSAVPNLQMPDRKHLNVRENMRDRERRSLEGPEGPIYLKVTVR